MNNFKELKGLVEKCEQSEDLVTFFTNAKVFKKCFDSIVMQMRNLKGGFATKMYSFIFCKVFPFLDNYKPCLVVCKLWYNMSVSPGVITLTKSLFQPPKFMPKKIFRPGSECILHSFVVIKNVLFLF